MNPILSFPPFTGAAGLKRSLLYPARGGGGELLLHKPFTLQCVSLDLHACPIIAGSTPKCTLHAALLPPLPQFFPLPILSPPLPLPYLLQWAGQGPWVEVECCCLLPQGSENGCRQNTACAIGSHFYNS